MVDGQWERVQAIFDEAARRSKDEQVAFLQVACGGDAALFAEVSSLLACDEVAPRDFLEPAKARQAECLKCDTDSLDRLIDATIGQYRVRSVIGHGGMGAVYLAEQANLKRNVALKVMRCGVASASALRRFELEGQVLSRLHHPHIAQVYEAGIHALGTITGGEDIPYFAMELVLGAHSITAYAHEKALSIPERVELFLAACDAVHHGHQKGVMHRDLKPGNILVDADGHVKVIDFGVARSTDADIAITTQITELGQLIGTVQYMSPEQFAADSDAIDIRSDVYALGTVLYELLTERLPYSISNMTIHAAGRVICEQEPANPALFNRSLRGNLETIILKAIAKERSKRYQSAGQLADDLRRHCNGEPIDARPPTVWVRVVRWATRHPKKVTAGASVLMACAIVGATLLSVRILHQRPARLVLLKTPQKQWHNAGYSAQLLSVTGDILEEWKGAADNAISGATLLQMPQNGRSAQLALIGFGAEYEGRNRGALCAFDVENPKQPIWVIRIEPADCLPALSDPEVTATDWYLQCFRVFNIFPKRPGDEVVCTFSSKYAARILRVYGLDKALLYQVWYNGAVGDVGWLSASRLLIIIGDNAAANALERGMKCAGRAYPRVLLAVRPEQGFIRNEFITEEPGEGLNPVWVRCLGPDWAQEIVTSWRLHERTSERSDATTAVRVAAGFYLGDDFSVSWDVDESGEEIPGSRAVSNEYQQNQVALEPTDPRRLPDPRSVVLVPLPPVIETSTNGESTVK